MLRPFLVCILFEKGNYGLTEDRKQGSMMKPVSCLFKEKIWITRALYSIGAILLSLGAFYLDLLVVGKFVDYIPSIFLTKVDEGQTILGILTAAMLTMMTFTFSTVLVVLTMYSSQFSPRAPENFIRSATTRQVLGIFLGGFLYNMLSFLYMQEGVFDHEMLSTWIGIVIVFLCIATFAYYIHFVATDIQVSTLINKLIADAEKVIAYYKGLYDQKHVTLENWHPENLQETVKAKQAGYVQFINLAKLVEIAEEEDAEIEVWVKIGDYVFEGKPLIKIHSTVKKEVRIKDHFLIGKRTDS